MNNMFQLVKFVYLGIVLGIVNNVSIGPLVMLGIIALFVTLDMIHIYYEHQHIGHRTQHE